MLKASRMSPEKKSRFPSAENSGVMVLPRPKVNCVFFAKSSIGERKSLSVVPTLTE
jgi:hypothetical protein